MKNKERFKGITPEIAGQFGGGGSSTVAYDIVLRLDIESAASIGDVSKENIIIEYADWETIKEKARCGEGLNISLGCSEYNT